MTVWLALSLALAAPSPSGAGTDPVSAAIQAPTDVRRPPRNASRTASGLAYRILSGSPTGQHPTDQATVTVHYTGWTTDGVSFDSSHLRGEPARFPLNRVIPGWTEGLQLIGPGQTVRLWIPKKLAYQGRPGAPQGMLVFDITLLAVAEPQVAPPDVAAPPADAERTTSGLAFRVLKAGSGTEHPAYDAVVTVHYTGWTTDGASFDSTSLRGQPARFPLDRVIQGWTEGVQLMVVGETTRFWIPPELAYGGRPGAPTGTLVFDIELLSIESAPAFEPDAG